MIPTLISALRLATSGHEFWEPQLAGLECTRLVPVALHLGIFVEPYLRYVLDGKKTVESRFSAKRIPPFGGVAPGDILILKRSGGAIVGICEIHQTWSYSLDPRSWGEIRSRFTDSLCAQDPLFWEARRGAAFATLMRIRNVCAIPPIEYPKRDRRGWVTLVPRTDQMELRP